MKRMLRKSLVLISIVTLSAAIMPSLTIGIPVVTSQTNNTIALAGLKDRVTVRRDERGIPYIEATNDDDLYFAQGFVTASDRLWQMDIQRRAARGELSEIFGQLALNEDKRHVTFGFARILAETAAHLPQNLAAVLDAYSKGVNAYIASLTDQTMLPEFKILNYKPRPWTPTDSLSIGKLMSEYLSTTWQLDVMRAGLAALPKEKREALLPEVSPLDVLVVGKDRNAAPTAWHGRPARESTRKIRMSPSPGVLAEVAQMIESDRRSLERLGMFDLNEALQASNNWVVSGKRTVSGKPLLANDPHIPGSAPNVWYMTELSAPGMHVAGTTFPGAPGIIVGHNDYIAWGVTNLGPDVQDVYLEKFDKDNPARYLTPAGWRDAEIRHEQIKVRKSFIDSTTETQLLDVTVTRHGPIILQKDSQSYALRWTALDPSLNESDAFVKANRARNWKEFTEALSSYGGPTQNFVYADIDGHIGYYGAGRIPIRKSGDGSVPYDGSTDAGEWTGWIPFDRLPHVFDPPDGIIVTANQRVAGADYPYFLSHLWAQPYRARRILELLKQTPRLSTDDFRRIQGDVYSIGLSSFARETARILKPQIGEDQKLRETVAALEAWDGRVNADSSVAPLTYQMRVALRSRILGAALGPDLAKSFAWPNFETTLDRIINNQPRDWLPKEFTDYAGLLKACYNDARQALTKSIGQDESKWKWGEMVKTRFAHRLADVPFIGAQFNNIPAFPQNGVGGMGATVNVGSSVSMRLIADMSDWDKSQHGIPLGESGLFSSPHWKDQLDDWRNVTPRAFPFSKTAVDAATKEVLLLEPVR